MSNQYITYNFSADQTFKEPKMEMK